MKKEREEPSELKYLRLLRPRRKLTKEENQSYWRLLKGFEGEKEFDRLLLREFFADCLVINDLLLEYNQAYFQIDSLLMFQNDISLVDVKNFEGDFYRDNQQWHAFSGKEIKNPLLQMQRSESAFRQLLQFFKFEYSVNASLVFINPEFQLYNASLNLPIVFPAQLYRLMNRLNEIPSSISRKQEHFADYLVSRHIKNSPFTIPNMRF